MTTTVAQKFIDELKSGNITEAIDTFKSGLEASRAQLIEQKRIELLESYGFKAIIEKETEDEDSDEDDEDEDDKKDTKED